MSTRGRSAGGGGAGRGAGGGGAKRSRGGGGGGGGDGKKPDKQQKHESYLVLNTRELVRLFGAVVSHDIIRDTYLQVDKDMSKAIDTLMAISGYTPPEYQNEKTNKPAATAAAAVGTDAKSNSATAAAASAVPIASASTATAASGSSAVDKKSSATGDAKALTASAAAVATKPDAKSASASASGFTLNEITGDLFAGAGSSASLGHCVSRCLAMGKGIAVLFKQKYGGVSELKAQNIPIGGCGVLKRDGRYVYYLVTKERYFHKPTYQSLEASLRVVRAHCVANGVRVLCLPRIGCGLDGLLWPTVRTLLHTVFDGAAITINIYTI